MAGIGFELRKILKRQSYSSLLEAYAYAGLIGSGPWVLSIIGVMLVGFLSIAADVPERSVVQFQISVTYLIAASLSLTGLLQLAFTRYTSDRLFEHQDDIILPNFHGALFLTLVSSGGLGAIIVVIFFPEQGFLYRLLMVSSFVTLSGIWMTTIFLAGMREYKVIGGLFGLGYSVTVGAAYALQRWQLEGLLSGFLFGQFVLLCGQLFITVRHFPARQLVAFDFLQQERRYPSLMGIGFLYNIGVWADKVMFWYFPGTSEPIIGPLRGSPVYDLPIFLAYLSIVPGMAAFLLRMETDFVEQYQRFYDGVRGGASLAEIEAARDEMVYAIRHGIFEICKIQGIATLVTLVFGPTWLRWLGISEWHTSLLYIAVVAAGIQVVFLGLINVLFYLDLRIIVLVLSGVFVVMNISLSALTLYLGSPYFGYGFAVSLLAVVLIGMYWLDRRLARLEYATFMLQ